MFSKTILLFLELLRKVDGGNQDNSKEPAAVKNEKVINKS